MYVGMDKRLFRLGESICGLFRGAHIDSQALKHSSTLDIVYSTLRFKWSIYCPFRVLLSANSLVQLVLRLPQFIPLSKRPLSGCRTSEFRFIGYEPGPAHRYLNISTPNQRVAPREIYRRLHILYRRIDRISIASLTLEIPFLRDYRPIIRSAKSIKS